MRTGDLAYLRSFMVFITVEVLGADRCTPRCHPGSPGRPQDTRNVVCTPAERSGIRGLFAVKVTCEYHRLALAEDTLQHEDLDQTISDKAASLSVALEGQASWLRPQFGWSSKYISFEPLSFRLLVRPFDLSVQRLAAAEQLK